MGRCCGEQPAHCRAGTRQLTMNAPLRRGVLLGDQMATDVIKDGQIETIHSSVVQQAIALGWAVYVRPVVQDDEPPPEKPRRGRPPKVDTGD